MEQTLQAREHWLGTLLVVAIALLFCAWQADLTVGGAAMIIGTAVLYTAAVRSFPIVLRITPTALGLTYLAWSGFQTDDVISLDGFCHVAGGVLVTALGCRFWCQSTRWHDQAPRRSSRDSFLQEALRGQRDMMSGDRVHPNRLLKAVPD